MARRSLIVGIGNPLLGADAFGPAVIERLRARVDLPPHVTLFDANTDLLNYIDMFANYDGVVLVDAFVGGPGTGDVTVVDEATFTQWDTASPDSHAVSAVLAIGLFRRLYSAAQTTIMLVGLDAPNLDSRDPLRGVSIDAGAAAVLGLIAAWSHF